MSKEIALRFDYGSLAGGVATEVARRTREIKELTRRAADDIVRIGNELAAVKAALPHGQFGVWLHAEFAWTERTARNMMRVAERFTSATVADLEFAPTALYLLSADDVPEAARQEAVQQAKAGKPVTPAAARAIVEKHVPPKPKPAERPPTPPPKTEMISVLPPEPTVIETTARDVTPPPSASTEPTATDLLTALSPIVPKLRKVKEDLAGNPFDHKAAGQYAAGLVSLIEGEPPAYRLVKAGDPGAQAAEIYDLYPRKVGRDKALVAIRNALKRVGFDELREAVAEFAKSPAGNAGEFTPHPATWFGEGRWNDDRSEWKRDRNGRAGKAQYKPGPGERFDPNAELRPI